MSAGLAGSTALAAGTARRTAPRPAPRRTTLQLVPSSRTSAPRTRFVALVAALLVTGLLGLLMLNTVLARNAFAVYNLSTQTRALDDSEQGLQREVELLRSPQNLAKRASELGMVQAGPPAFLRLSDGAVLGATEPAGAAPAVVPSPAKPSAATVKPSPAASKPTPAAVKPSPAAAKPSPAVKTPTAPKVGTTPSPGAAR